MPILADFQLHINRVKYRLKDAYIKSYMFSQDNAFEIKVHWGDRVCLHVSGTIPLNISRLSSVLGIISVI